MKHSFFFNTVYTYQDKMQVDIRAMLNPDILRIGCLLDNSDTESILTEETIDIYKEILNRISFSYDILGFRSDIKLEVYDAEYLSLSFLFIDRAMNSLIENGVLLDIEHFINVSIIENSLMPYDVIENLKVLYYEVNELNTIAEHYYYLYD